MILVTAANGNQGRLLIPRLLAAAASVRACVRTEASAAVLRSMGVADVMVGDISDHRLMARAMEEVETVYHVGPTLHPREREIGFLAVDVARASGVRHFVFSSVLHAITTDLIQHEIKRDVEEHLLSSGLDFTILQPTNYMLPSRLRSVFDQGVFRLPWSLERYQSLVDLGDVTEVAAAVLTDGGRHAGATYELVAPGRHTGHDLQGIISEVLGRDIALEQISADTFLKGFLGGLDATRFPYETRLLRAICTGYSNHDFVGNPNVLTWLLGRQPTTYAQFVEAQFDGYRKTQILPTPPPYREDR